MRERIEITFDPKTVFAESDLPDAKDGDLFHYLLNELNAHGIQTTIAAAKGCADTPASTKNWRYCRVNGTAHDFSIVNEHGGLVATSYYEQHARRVVASVNACGGFSTDDLEAATADKRHRHEIITDLVAANKLRDKLAQAATALLGKLDVMSGCNVNDMDGPEEWPEFTRLAEVLDEAETA